MPHVLDRWAVNGSVRIHFIDKPSTSPGQLPLVVSPGIWEPAERGIPLLESMTRRGISLSYRGRGRSDTPDDGYDLEPHIADLAAVADGAGVDRFGLLAFSRGVGPALGYTLAHPTRVEGLVLVDHPPIHFAWAPGTSATWKGRVYLGRPFTDFMRPAAFDGIEREARQVEFWKDLPRLTCPVLHLRGLDTSAVIPSEVAEADSVRYRALVRNYREVGFDRSGHMIPDEEPDKYCRVVSEFLVELDRAAYSPAGGSPLHEVAVRS